VALDVPDEITAERRGYLLRGEYPLAVDWYS
jgi:hypothetical protein